MKKLMVSFVTLAAAVALAASTATLHLSSTMTAGGTELKAGEYKVSVEGTNAMFKTGQKVVTIPATTEKGNEKFKFTSMESTGTTLKSIHVGGTDTTIVFSTPAVTGGGL